MWINYFAGLLWGCRRSSIAVNQVREACDQAALSTTKKSRPG